MLSRRGFGVSAQPNAERAKPFWLAIQPQRSFAFSAQGFQPRALLCFRIGICYRPTPNRRATRDFTCLTPGIADNIQYMRLAADISILKNSANFTGK